MGRFLYGSFAADEYVRRTSVILMDFKSSWLDFMNFINLLLSYHKNEKYEKWMLVLFVALFVLPYSRDAHAADRKKKGKNAYG